jgi:hypothetical protein
MKVASTSSPPRENGVGPALAALGLLGAAAIALAPAAGRSTLTWWILSSALAPERVLPLVGLGVALALVHRRYSLGALALFGGGVAVGFLSRTGCCRRWRQFRGQQATTS